MKQAILVTAYKDIDRLKLLTNQFDDNFYFYIHIDKKSQIPKEDIELLENSKNVRFISREYNVNWGGFNHSKSILLLAEEAIKDNELEYIHLISGQDYPIKSCKEIKQFLTENKGYEFLENFELPFKEWSRNGGLDRVDYYNFYDLLDAKTKWGSRIMRWLVKIQKLFKFKRSRRHLPNKLYGGWSWFTLTYPCMKYIIDYTENNPLFLKRFEYTAIACEVYFHTIIMNSPFKKRVVNNDLRYILWDTGGAHPDVLDENDYDGIIKSDAIFARKIEYPTSKSLIEKINSHILNDFNKGY